MGKLTGAGRWPNAGEAKQKQHVGSTALRGVPNEGDRSLQSRVFCGTDPRGGLDSAGGLQTSRSMCRVGWGEGVGPMMKADPGERPGWAFAGDPGVWKAMWSLGGRRLAGNGGSGPALPKDPLSPRSSW